MTDNETTIRQQEFMNLTFEAIETGDDSRLIAWWRKNYPGYKWWLTNMNYICVLPDDGKDEPRTQTF